MWMIENILLLQESNGVQKESKETGEAAFYSEKAGSGWGVITDPHGDYY